MVERPTTVLLVDDEPSIRRAIRRALDREGFTTVEAADGVGAIAEAGRTHVHVAVLDLHLPDMPGLDVLARLREEIADLHVIILSGAASEDDRVLGLVSGADDYMVKPFSARELVARIRAARRKQLMARPEVIETCGLRIDAVARTVMAGAGPIDLTRREFDLLHHLAANPGLYDHVIASAEPVGRDAAAAVGVSRSLAAFHLDRLADEGLLEVEYRRLSGRTGPGAGRPAKLYRRAVRQVDVTLPPRGYALAAEVLAHAVEQVEPEAEAPAAGRRLPGGRAGRPADDRRRSVVLDRSIAVTCTVTPPAIAQRRLA